jgi:anti-sigma B factor antagonist
MGGLDLNCSVSVDAGVTILKLAGRLDHQSVVEFREFALQQLRGGSTKLVVDMAALEAVDGQGLATFVNFYRQVKIERKGRLALAGLNPDIRALLDRTSLSRVIPIAYDWQEAAKELRS